MMTLSVASQIVERVAGALCLLALGLSAVYFAWDQHQTQVSLRATITSANTTVQGLSATLNVLNAPCTGFHGSTTCGPLAQLSQTIKNIGILSGQATEQVKQSASLVNGATESLRSTSGKVTEMADAFVRTANAGTETLQEATSTLGEGKRTIAAMPPLLDAYTRSGNDLDALLKSRAITGTLDNLQGTTGHVNAITGDMQKVSDDLTRRYFTPMPLWKKALTPVEFTVKAGNKILGWW